MTPVARPDGGRRKLAERELLAGYLAELHPRQLERLAVTLEQDREAGEYRLPHEEILELLRPWLMSARLGRFPTTQRMLCMPLEDFLSAGDPKLKLPSQIARPSLASMWHFLTEQVAKDQMAAAGETYREAAKSGDRERLDDAARVLWRTAAEALAKPVERMGREPAYAQKLVKMLGGTRRAEDLREMAALFDVADEIETLKRSLPPKPIKRLTDPQVSLVKRVYLEVAEAKPGREPYIVLAVLARLRETPEILKVVHSIAPRLDPAALATTDLGVVADVVVRQLEGRSEDVERAVKEATSDVALADSVDDFVTTYSGTARQIKPNSRDEWGRRILKARESVGRTVVDRVLRTASTTVMRGIEPPSPSPSSAAAEAQAPVPMGFDAYPDEAALTEAEARAAAVGRLRRHGDALGINNAVHKAVDTLRRKLNEHGERLMKRFDRVAPDRRDYAEAHLMATVRLTELIAGTEEADKLRKEGERALSDAVGRYAYVRQARRPIDDES
ncbi:MAG: hypothetical protein AB7G39_06755 [Alphaproteobacteria bacterium]